jgi:hypothetical protein
MPRTIRRVATVALVGLGVLTAPIGSAGAATHARPKAHSASVVFQVGGGTLIWVGTGAKQNHSQWVSYITVETGGNRPSTLEAWTVGFSPSPHKPVLASGETVGRAIRGRTGPRFLPDTTRRLT